MVRVAIRFAETDVRPMRRNAYGVAKRSCSFPSSRLKPGVTQDQAQAEMSAIASALAREYPRENKDKGIAIVPIREDLVGETRKALLVLLGAVGFVLLIACANVANLLLARSAARRREFAVRSALGAGRTRLVRQVLTEGVLLAIAGAAVGLALARGLVVLFMTRVADDLLGEQATEKAPYSIAIDEELARAVFAGKDPLGERLHLDLIDADYEVVGIVGHVRHWGLERDSTEKIRAQMYFSFRQLPDAIMPAAANNSGWIVRTAVAPGVMGEQIKRAVFGFNPNMTMYGNETMDDIISDSLAQKRFARLLLGAFALLALVLAAIGIYGVMSQFVLQNTHDIGVRMALGAAPHEVLVLMLRSAMAMALGGIVLGAAASLAATRLMRSMLFGVGANDPGTFVAVSAILAAVAFLASYLPARRATRVDPMVVLRHE